MYLVKFYVVLMITLVCKCCQIAGKQNGICQARQNVLSQSSFCINYVAQSICVPLKRKTWDYDVAYRDTMIEQIFISSMEKKMLEEYQSRITTTLALSNNKQCFYAYKEFICAWNFPECIKSENRTIGVCRGLCEKFYTLCKSSAEACEIIHENLSPGLRNC